MAGLPRGLIPPTSRRPRRCWRSWRDNTSGQPRKDPTMAMTVSREIRLKYRPVGLPSESDFELVTVSVPAPGAGEVLVRNLYMSVDPYMRGRMTDQQSYVQPFQMGQPLDGGCVGQVVQSQGGKFQVGDYVLGRKGWREYYVSDGEELTRIDPDL